jgi:uncharacterized protein
MKINIAQLRQAIGARQSFNFSTQAGHIAGEGNELWLRGPVEITGEAVNNGSLIAVSGLIKGTAAMNCNRCLTDFTREVAIPFGENFRDQSTAVADPDALSYHGDEIDLAEIVREALIVAEPLKALCSEDCRGLCPICGINRNDATCACETVSIDPRLAALAKLLPKK